MTTVHQELKTNLPKPLLKVIRNRNFQSHIRTFHNIPLPKFYYSAFTISPIYLRILPTNTVRLQNLKY